MQTRVTGCRASAIDQNIKVFRGRGQRNQHGDLSTSYTGLTKGVHHSRGHSEKGCRRLRHVKKCRPSGYCSPSMA